MAKTERGGMQTGCFKTPKTGFWVFWGVFWGEENCFKKKMGFIRVLLLKVFLGVFWGRKKAEMFFLGFY